MKCDFLVIGSGIAGLSYALKAAEFGDVLIVTKGELNEGNTLFAQGGVAAVTYAPDSKEKHFNDTMICGAGRSDERAVRLVVDRAPILIKQMVDWGVKFDKNSSGRYDLAREGGHTEYRILHHKDNTGYELQMALSRQVKKHPRIKILEHHFALELLTQHHLGQLVKHSTPNIECYGAYVVNLKKKEVITILAKATVLAAGGIGNIYHTTTNPSVATGDGIAMVHRAKGVIEDMEFVQFHPTSLYNPGERPSFLISEAMRGFGAILKTQDGVPFMQKYHQMGSLAPRDVVAQGIDNEMKIRGDEFVYLDVRSKSPEEIIQHFPNIYQKCLSIGIDITQEMIPVVPAAHYCCGGVTVDTNGCTSINRLYALGETSSTGLHGANRLASNSLIEAAVYADQAATHSVEVVKNVDFAEGIPEWDYEGTSHPEEMVLITQNCKELQQVMTNYVGIVRSNQRLERAYRRLGVIYNETEHMYSRLTLSKELCELRNMLAVGYLIIKQAMQMKESVGAHYSLDYPKEPRKI